MLTRNLLNNQSGAEDITSSTPNVAISFLYFPKLAEIEVERAILKVKGMASEKDGISISVLRLAWVKFSFLVRDLFHACIDIGYYLHCFHSAILAIIEKSNILDMSSPRSYGPIALLSVHGKRTQEIFRKKNGIDFDIN